MFSYNIQLAIKSLKESMALTVIMIAAIGIGLGLFMTMYTMAYQSGKMPLANKSERLFSVQLDNRETSADAVTNSMRMVDLTYQDAVNLLALPAPAIQQTLVWNSSGIMHVPQSDIRPLRASFSVTNNAFFTMFDVPFLYGGGWSVADDEQGSASIVLSKETNQLLFGGVNSVGQQVSINSSLLTVVGVLDDWQLTRRFYDRSFSRGRPDQAFIPNSYAINQQLPRNARFDCWSTDVNGANYRSNNLADLLANECAWVSFWAEVAPTKVAEYRQHIDQYVASQKLIGRFPRALNNFVTSLNAQVDYLNRRGGSVGFLLLIAQMFFVVCLVNAVGILLAKLLRKTKEVSLRRALGAKKSTIMMQYLIEVIFIGVLGGLFGLLLSYLGLYSMLKINRYASDYTISVANMEPYYQLDFAMISTAFLVSIVATIIVGLYPIIRLCNVSPARELKAQ
jgi:putative ABC transport system permease protein